MWVTLNEDWKVRPIQDGVELMAPERNIALELSDLSYRKQVMAILTGEEEIPEDNEAIRDALQQLKQAGVDIRTSQAPAQRKSPGAIQEVIDKVRQELVGSRGPITGVYRLSPKQSHFSSFSLHAVTAKYAAHGEDEDEWAGAADEDPLAAEVKAIMEALERYASGIIPREQLVKTTSRKLKEQAINPRRVVAYVKTQYRGGLPFAPFSRDREYYWKSVSVLPGGEEKYLPVECLYYPVDHELTPNLYTAASSSGVAAGTSFEDALLRGLYEAIERDAFMLVWLNRMRMPRIDSRTLPQGQQNRIALLESLGYEVYLADITLDLAPVVLAIAVSRTLKPALVLGAASGPLEQVVGKALGEVEYQLYWTLRHPNHVQTLKDPKQVKDVLDHAALYASQEHLSQAEFLWKGETRPLKKSDSYDGDCWSVVDTLTRQGIEMVALDLTPQSFKKMGIWVVRAIPLGLIPISFGYGMEPLGMSRLATLSMLKNPWPRGAPFTHPFA